MTVLWIKSLLRRLGAGPPNRFGIPIDGDGRFELRDAGLRIRKALLGVTLTRGPTVNLRLRDFERLLRLLGAGQIPDVLAMFLREFRFELADAIVQLDEMMGTLRRTTWTTMYLVQGVTFLLRS